MNIFRCIKDRRRIHRYSPDSINHSIIDSIASAASYSPSRENTLITHYITIENSFICREIMKDFCNTDEIKYALVI